jgi:hypothetical protein
MGAFDDHLFGNLSGTTPLPEVDLRRIVTRAQRRADRGMQPPGFYRARAAERHALARQISEALQARDMVHARLLIEEGAARFGHGSMLAAVEVQASQDRTAALEPVRESYRPEADLGEQAGAYESDYGRHYNEVDRQRANLAQFDDVGELVDAWRAGNVSWDYDAWGPDPDDVGCLIPWDPEAGS